MSSTDMAAIDPEKDLLPERQLLRLNDWAEPLGWVLAVAAASAGIFLLLVDPASAPSDGSLRPLPGLVWLAFGLFMAAGSRAGLMVERNGVSLSPGSLQERKLVEAISAELNRRAAAAPAVSPIPQLGDSGT